MHKPEHVKKYETLEIKSSKRLPNNGLITKSSFSFKKWHFIKWILPDHKLKVKETENVDKYQDLVKKSKKLCNMKTMVIPFVVLVTGTVPQESGKKLDKLDKKRLKPSRSQHIKKVLEKSYRSEGSCCHSDSWDHQLEIFLKTRRA